MSKKSPSAYRRDKARMEAYVKRKKAMQQPPVDNDFVADGCEKFSERTVSNDK